MPGNYCKDFEHFVWCSGAQVTHDLSDAYSLNVCAVLGSVSQLKIKGEMHLFTDSLHFTFTKIVHIH